MFCLNRKSFVSIKTITCLTNLIEVYLFCLVLSSQDKFTLYTQTIQNTKSINNNGRKGKKRKKIIQVLQTISEIHFVIRFLFPRVRCCCLTRLLNFWKYSLVFINSLVSLYYEVTRLNL